MELQYSTPPEESRNVQRCKYGNKYEDYIPIEVNNVNCVISLLC